MVVLLQPATFDSDVYVNPKCKPSPVLIPVVDLTEPDAKTQIVKACEEFGFFKIVSHGVLPDLMTQLEQEANNFFALPHSLKEKAGPTDPFGYGSKQIGSKGDMGWIEYILLNANNHLESTKTAAVFQQTPTIFREAVEEYMEEMKGISSKVLDMVAEELKIEPKEKLSNLVRVKESDSCLRMNHYPDKEESPAKEEIGFGEHTDPQLISVLRSNDTEGLQICVKDGTWVAVPPDHSSFFVIVGDTLQVLTNGRFKSVKHRVLTNTKKSRLSMIYFAGPPLTEKIAPLSCLVPKQEDWLYKEFTWSQYKSSAYKTKLGDYRLEPSDPMTDNITIAAQLALLMEQFTKRFNGFGERFDKVEKQIGALQETSATTAAATESNTAVLQSLTSVSGTNQKGKLASGPPVKFTEEQLLDVELLSGTQKIREAIGGAGEGTSPCRWWWCLERKTNWSTKHQQGFPPNDFRVQDDPTWKTTSDRDLNHEKRLIPAAKMDFPSYDGTTNAIEWLQKCEDYFTDQGVISDEARVRQATFVLTGKAYHWNNNLRRLVTQQLSWREFKQTCKSRYGKADSVNPMGELSNLRHTRTVDDYCRQFEECLGRQTKLTVDQQSWLFCAGLTDSLSKEVEYLRLAKIFKAMEYARDNECQIDNDKRTRTFGGHLAPARRSIGVLQPQQEEAKQATPRKYWKKLTVEEMAEPKAKGLCFNCDELFTRDHACNPMLFHIMPVRDGDNQEDEPYDEENWKDE
ncbi:unnamed protein product [Microthlaspi erraticum]|uniref:gibberellin 2beta-dioxygenase n=1 Tax=Microthlaspi erraticum TaxID=1685480 RepID=A0A6D2HGA5_9BRAS|nr:unnamed protein product [Microthlaspi erraticum]